MNPNPDRIKPSSSSGVRTFLRICSGILILAVIVCSAHYLVFPQESRCMLIRSSGFRHTGRIYCRTNEPRSKTDSLLVHIKKAQDRVRSFWGNLESDPLFIYCSMPEDFSKYSEVQSVPAVTHLKMGAYIVLNKDGDDTDIIAHEISHAELYTRIGFFKWNFEVPAWFKHGLAMQNDYRNYYSTDSLPEKLKAFPGMLPVQACLSDGQFYSGPLPQVMLRYMLAKAEVGKWYTREKLLRLTDDLRSGMRFKVAYAQGD